MKNRNTSSKGLNAIGSEERILGRPGPRTPQVKRRARYNPLKHGIFANVVLEDRESKPEYDRLHKGFMEYFRPEGVPEAILVEKLAMLFWRSRRGLQAETAAFGGSAGPTQEGNTESDELVELKDIPFGEERGLIGASLVAGNTKGLLRALVCVAELRQKIKCEGPDWDRDRQTIESLLGIVKDYEAVPNSWRPRWQEAEHDQDVDGDESKRASLALLKKYRISAPFEHKATRLEFEGEPIALTGDATVDLVTALTEQIKVLRFILAGRVLGGIHSRCRQPGGPGGMLLRPEIADQLLRYEVTIDRAIDRTLAQLERLQRMRLGQPVPPPVKVELST